ncbi:hypothetical protein GH714_030326 [Hevea brasiliensis]|uniref:NB-ARC domain-containing protein n=1 Tax=Hevea brasiliensis TaxID=3981 RepID=A0A6A6KED2_HEVBR|nr:hypothetical protein GH714_030326 [Hevea brasiliensis]
MFTNEEKLNWVSVPFMLRLERFNLETVPVVSQEMAVQLQRLLRLVKDQEFREGGKEDKLFLHWMRASACVLGDESYWLSYILLKKIAIFITECPKLIFDLSDDLTRGQIQMQLLTHLQNLEFLNLTAESFEGLFPTEIRIYAKLQNLTLGINKLNGTIPEEIGYMSKLDVLELHENEFYRPLPSSIGNLRMLRYLNLT